MSQFAEKHPRLARSNAALLHAVFWGSFAACALGGLVFDVMRLLP
jgi:hypothetical protein